MPFEPLNEKSSKKIKSKKEKNE